MERVRASFQVKNLSEDDKYFKFSGLASTFGNVDLDGDVIMPGAFSDSIDSDIPILWQHDRSEPVGISASLKETEEGLLIEALMPKDDTFVKGRVMPQVRIGSIKSMSIGFMLSREDYTWSDDSSLRIINKAHLKETSLVTFPANPKAKITDFKSISEMSSIRDFEKFLRSNNFSKSAANKFVSDFKGFILKQSESEDKNNLSDSDLIKGSLDELQESIKTQKAIREINKCLKNLRNS